MAFEYPPCTYRVSVKAVIVHEGKVVLVKEDADQWELPGGGLEHKEDIVDALYREIQEELGAELVTLHLDKMQPWATFDEGARRPLLFLVYPATIDKLPGSNIYNDVEIGLFDTSELTNVPLVPYIESFRQNLISLVSESKKEST